MKSLFSDYRGVKIFTDFNVVDEKQVRFPTSKKRRIRKKWEARRRNWRAFPSKKFYRLAVDAFLCHPVMARELEEDLSKNLRPLSL